MAATNLRSLRSRPLPHAAIEECSGERRQSIVEYFTENIELEDEFFRRRTLSLGDFDGTRELSSHIRLREGKKRPAHHHIEVLFPPPSESRCQTNSRIYDWDYGPTPATMGFLDRESKAAWFSDEESISDDQSCMLPEQLETLIGKEQNLITLKASLTHEGEPSCTIDPELRIKTVRSLEAPLIHSSNVAVRALVPSMRGEIDNASTSGLTHDTSDEETFSVLDPSFDASPAPLQLFSQAGVLIKTQNIRDDSVAAQVTSLADSSVDPDHTSQIETDRVIYEFFGMSKSRAASSSLEAASSRGTIRVHKRMQRNAASTSQQCLISAVCDELADEDCYPGRDANTLSNPCLSQSPSTPSESIPSTDDNMLPAPLRYEVHRLGEAPRKDKFHISAFDQPDTIFTTHDVPLNQLSVTHSEQPVQQPVTKKKTFTSEIMAAKAPTRTFTHMQRRVEKLDLRRKRKADEHESTSKSKRARLAFLEKHLDQVRAHASYLNVARSITPIRDTSTASPKSSLNSQLFTSPMPKALKGFTGQFELYISDQLSYLKTSTTHRAFGSPTHPNGMITNTCFTSATRHAHFNLTDRDINHDASFHAVVQHAEQQSIEAASLHALRTREENELRKEAHRECTSACLEGVCVGYYRYFLGHMTVEEYVEAGLCVCWEKCFCNKFCTRFGDLRCPCAGNLVMVD